MGHMREFFLISLPRKVGFITHSRASTWRCWDGGKCKTPGELAQSGRSSTSSDAVKHQVLMRRPQIILDFDCRPITCSIPELHPVLQSRPSGILGIFIWSKSHSSFEFVSTAVTFGLSSGRSAEAPTRSWEETAAASRKWVKHLSSRVSAALRYRSSFFYEWPACWVALVLRSEPPRTRWRERRHLCEESAEPCALWGGGSRTWKFKTVQQAVRGSLPRLAAVLHI